VTSIAPSATPNRTGVRIHRRCRIHARCRIDRIFINHHWRRRYNDRPANHECLGNDGSRLLDNDRWRRPVLVRVNFPLIAWNFESEGRSSNLSERAKPTFIKLHSPSPVVITTSKKAP